MGLILFERYFSEKWNFLKFWREETFLSKDEPFLSPCFWKCSMRRKCETYLPEDIHVFWNRKHLDFQEMLFLHLIHISWFVNKQRPVPRFWYKRRGNMNVLKKVFLDGDGRNWVGIFHKTRHVCNHEITITNSN